MKYLLNMIVVTGLLLVIAGCASTLSGESYSRSEARRAQSVEYGTVEYIRPVMIEGTKTAVGPAAGAAVGGVAGSSVGGGKGRTIATVVGAVAGGLAGAAVEEGVTRRDGEEITVRLSNNRTIAVVQEIVPGVIFRVGDRVRVLTVGGATRVAQ